MFFHLKFRITLPMLVTTIAGTNIFQEKTTPRGIRKLNGTNIQSKYVKAYNPLSKCKRLYLYENTKITRKCTRGHNASSSINFHHFNNPSTSLILMIGFGLLIVSS